MKKNETDLEEIMSGLKGDLPVCGIKCFSIDRQELWEDSIAAFKDQEFNVKFRPKVRFLGEAGIDAGGLSREYGITSGWRRPQLAPEVISIQDGERH